MELVDSFHFTRPWALILIPLLILQVLWYLRFRHASNPWQQRMRPDLQQHLLAEPTQQPRYLLWIILALILAGTALAGPSWSKQSRPVLSKQDNLVIVLDLSLSMLAEDLSPNRITRARQKLYDLLDQRNEGMTALVAYSGAAHTVTPLTRDSATIRNLLPALDPQLMPEAGSAAERGVRQARQLIRQSGFHKGRILLVTDGLETEARQKILRLNHPDISLSLLTVGTAEGAPIPLADQGFVKDDNGNVIISRLQQEELEAFARDANALIHPITLDNRDLELLLPDNWQQQSVQEEKASAPIWIEQGHWFLLPVLPLAALAFRRNWLMLLPLLLLLNTPQNAYAFWPESKNQQGQQAFAEGDFDQAEQLLEDPLWLGSAHYRQQEYAEAIREFAKSDSARAHYNRGNALARLGRYEEAIQAYSLALERDPALNDADYNRSLVEQLLKDRQAQDQAARDKPQQPQSQQEQSKPEQQQSQQEQQQQSESQQQQSQQEQQAESEQRPSESQASGPQNPAQQPRDRADNPQASGQGQNGEQDRQPPAGDKASGQPDKAEAAQPSPDKAGKKPESPDSSPEGGRESRSQTASGENAANNPAQPMTEEQLSLEQWLRRIPDDPAGLLRRKFEYEARQQQEPLPEGRTPW